MSEPTDEPTAELSANAPRPPATDAEARALASGTRWRILRLTFEDGLTNRQIADELDMNPATTLHHVRTLVDTGFLEPSEPRRGRRGAREIPYRATGKTWRVNAGDLTNPLIEAFVAEFVATPYEQRTLSRVTMNLTAAEIEELRNRMGDLVDEFRSRPRQPDSEQWGLFIATHPGRR